MTYLAISNVRRCSARESGCSTKQTHRSSHPCSTSLECSRTVDRSKSEDHLSMAYACTLKKPAPVAFSIERILSMDSTPRHDRSTTDSSVIVNHTARERSRNHLARRQLNGHRHERLNVERTEQFYRSQDYLTTSPSKIRAVHPPDASSTKYYPSSPPMLLHEATPSPVAHLPSAFQPWAQQTMMKRYRMVHRQQGQHRVGPMMTTDAPSAVVKRKDYQSIVYASSYPGMDEICVDPNRKGGQVRFTHSQSIELERVFSVQKYISPQERKQMACMLHLSERQVKTWFQNRRAKWRRLKIEAEMRLRMSGDERRCGSHGASESADTDSDRSCSETSSPPPSAD